MWGLEVGKRRNTKLAPESLKAIAERLDVAGFSLKDELQPKGRDELSEFNQKRGKKAIKTFGEGVSSAIVCRLIRRRLYRARDEYVHALKTPSKSSSTIPKRFWSSI